MKTVSHIRTLRKRDREDLLKDNPGFLARVAEKTGKTVATVSRVFHGKIERSPEVQAALDKEIEILEKEKSAHVA